MAHHRCTRCKEESYPRHKYCGGVYCDRCIQWIRGYRPSYRRGWLGSWWERIVDFTTSIFRPESPKHIERARERGFNTRLKAMETRARSIPGNPQSGAPQKY